MGGGILTEHTFSIHGLDCADEVTVLRRAVGPLVGGGDHLRFDLLHGRMTVDESADVTVEAVVTAVARTGMRAEVWREQSGREARGGRPRGRTIVTIASGLLMLTGFAVHASQLGVGPAVGATGGVGGSDVPLLVRALYAAGIVSGVWFVLPRAWYAARTLRPDMHLLMTLAVAGAVVIGEWFEAATVSFLFALSLALESWSVRRARRAVETLLAMAPTTVRIVDTEGLREVSAEQVDVGTPFLVKPGERVPLDGDVKAGTSLVNEAPITGESLPVAKEPGETVFAGSINGDGALEIRSTKPAHDTVLAHMIRLVRQAQTRRAPSEQWVDGFARIYTPAVMALAFSTAVVPPMLGAAWGDWVYRGLVLLVIGCPCALVISTPVSIVASLTAAASHGVLIKGGVYVEAPARLSAIAFDKTGTLTEGRPIVVDVVPLGDHPEPQLLAIAAGMEVRSSHPLAHAIAAHASERGVESLPVQDVQAVPGRGVTGQIDGRAYWVGSHRYLRERHLDTPEIAATLATLQERGQTVVAVGDEDRVCGLVVLTDPLRPAARGVVDELRAAGLDSIVMLTGDNRATAQTVGKLAGVDEIRAELLPEDKVAAVESLLERHGPTAMVGDGVNDAPAMARATLGIAMGAAGSDAAIETADIALMVDDLAKLPWLVRHARRTLAIIRQNIGVALGVKATFVALTFLGAASLWAAIAADMGASFLVTFNGLRLLKA